MTSLWGWSTESFANDLPVFPERRPWVKNACSDHDPRFVLRYAGSRGHADKAISTIRSSVAVHAPSQACADMPCTTAA
jgi:hypothetical protein